MTKNKNLQNKDTVSGNKAESNTTNCGKNQYSEKNKTNSSYKNRNDEDMEERDEY